jgi:hypothetical protein
MLVVYRLALQCCEICIALGGVATSVGPLSCQQDAVWRVLQVSAPRRLRLRCPLQLQVPPMLGDINLRQRNI